MIAQQQKQNTLDLLSKIQKSPTAFQAVELMETELSQAGFKRLNDGDYASLEKGGKYYVVRNGSTLAAFELPSKLRHLMIVASHTDSPSFKIKPVAQSKKAGNCQGLNVEPYGGMIMSSWMDRPLSVAGRAIVKDGNSFLSRSVVLDKDLCIIPSVAIHFNRSVNIDCTYNPAIDLQPLLGMDEAENGLSSLIAQQLQVKEEQIVGMDLFLYNRTPGVVCGINDELYACPRIDNLACAFTTLEGFLQAKAKDTVGKIYVSFDNEETGSSTKQGAASHFLRDVLESITSLYKVSLQSVLSDSMMVSADNGHAIHPNHPEYSDNNNAPVMNGGIVIKTNAAQKYATDAMASSIFRDICQKGNVPTQFFANRSDIPGGSTLGNISDTIVPLCTVDIGMAQLAMHSSYETAGTSDPYYMQEAIRLFYESELTQTLNGFECK